MRLEPLRRARSVFLTLLVLAACGGDSISGPAGEACGPGPYFTVLPAAANDIAAISVIGGLGAPGHTLPTPHAGLFLARENVPIRVPGDMAITELRRVTYLQSPTRQGERDYAVNFQVCSEVTGWFGHIVTLAPTIPTASIEWRNCETYSTSDERVESCLARPRDLRLSAGDALGTGGLSAARGFLAVDIGLLDTRVRHTYVSPGRFSLGQLHAVCTWEQFDAANRSVLFSKLRDLARPGVAPAGEPRCGTLQVDVAGTAQGVWAETGVSGPVQGDERRYITLANYPYRPQDELALSLGPANLGPFVAVVPRRSSGRVNRAFDQVRADGQIYCYTQAEAPTFSWFVSLTSDTALRIERVTHAVAASPCAADPGTWRFGGGAVSMVR